MGAPSSPAKVFLLSVPFLPDLPVDDDKAYALAAAALAAAVLGLTMGGGAEVGMGAGKS